MPEQPLNEVSDGILAVRFARSCVDNETRGSPVIDVAGRLGAPQGAFVTLMTHPSRELRGCIGFPLPIMPLRDIIREAAISACHDPRFPDLEASELEGITVEVTMMTPPETITGDIPSQVEIGKHGLMISQGFHRGLLLPQVATEYHWDVYEFLDETCWKAGLPPGSWKAPDAVVQRFSGDIFSETEPYGDIVERDRMDIEKVICGRAWRDGDLKYTEIGISDGKIVAAGSMVRGGDERIDLGSSLTILPGFMDPHVHFRDPGMTHKEDFSSGTLAAVHAGVTCILDMPNTKPPVTDLETLMAKKRAVSGRSYVDYGLFAAITPNINAGMLAHQVPGFKLFMGSTTGNILLNDDEELVPAVENALSTGKRVSVHAEDDSLILKEPEKCTRDHLRNRPAEAEWNAIRRLASNFKGRRINICHITTTEGLDMAKAAGFTTECTMHHITFDVDRNPGAAFKVNPPIRNDACRDALRKRFLAGDIDMVGTDHAPHTSDEKSQDFDSAPGGMPGVETTMPILMEMFRSGGIPLDRVMRMGAENPCDAFGIPKGRIAVGMDADLAIFDIRASSTIDPKKLHSRCGHSEYGGFRAVFPHTVMVGGEVQIEGWEFCGDAVGEDICGRRGRLLRAYRKEG